MEQQEPNRENLNHRQRIFADEYLQTGNASESYRKAGYHAKNGSAESLASRLLRNVNVAGYIKARQNELGKDAKVAQADLIAALKVIAFSDIRDYLDSDDRGIFRLKSQRDIPPEVQGAIQSIYVKETETVTKGGKRVIRRNFRIRLHDKVRGLAMLARHLGLDKGPPEREFRVSFHDHRDPTILSGLKKG